MKYLTPPGHTILELLVCMLVVFVLGHTAALSLSTIRESRLATTSLRVQRFLEEAVIASASSPQAAIITFSSQSASISVNADAPATRSLPIALPHMLADENGRPLIEKKIHAHHAEYCTPATLLLSDRRSHHLCYLLVSLRCRVRSVCA